jgi:hemoglobin-like flavoprotein
MMSPLTNEQIETLRTSFRALAARGDEMAGQFYLRLFARQPSLRAVLPRDEWQRNRDLLTGLGMVVKNLHRLGAVEHLLMEFGAKAARAGVTPQQYGVARESMLDAMRGVAGSAWTEELEEGWGTALNTAASVVLLGAGRSRARAA